MQTVKFKTNIKCSGCLAKATPFLNEVAGEDNWEVNVNHPDKVLTIATEESLPENTILEAVEKAGYKAEKIG